jgi:hypothetical protein
MKKAENRRIEYDAVSAAADDDNYNDYDTIIVMIMMMINSRQI